MDRRFVEDITRITGKYVAMGYEELLHQAYAWAAEQLRLHGTGVAGPAALYAELGLLPNCEDEVLEAAYRALARKHHPDHGGDAKRMARVTAAYREVRRLRQQGGAGEGHAGD